MTSVSSLNKAIGGYFELELPPPVGDYHQGVLKYQSARAAFLSLLRSMPEVKRVWMPCYICDSMLSPVRAAGKEIAFYNLDGQFRLKERIALASTEVLLYVNYFGVCNQQAQEVLEKLNPEQVVIDCSQSFYSAPSDCLATIYSPRKFFGVPDGGFLATSRLVALPEAKDNDSLKRMQHLIRRLASSPESGYESYKQAENSLQELEPKRMSVLTRRLLGSIDYSGIQQQRKENFRYLHEHLSATNQLSLTMTDVTPLCYPYMPTEEINKGLLLRNSIYIPTYWPEVLHRSDSQSAEEKFVKYLIAIPCDQRYKPSDLGPIIFHLRR